MLRRSALSLALTLPFTTACASSHLVVQAKQPTLADRVDWVHDRPRPPERSLSLAQNTLYTSTSVHPYAFGKKVEAQKSGSTTIATP